jgi:hypothetical protein
MQSLAGDRQMARAKLELGSVETQLSDAIRRWKILAIIGRLLEIVRKRYETDRQPETLREASQYLVRLTGGHYTRVWMPLDRRGLLVENDKGDSLSLDLLSRGTREAVFIGLRLSLLTSFARRGATLPLVLDDVLVNFDSGRVRCAAEVLCEFATRGHQVIMFTCHEHITDIFEDAKAEIRVLPPRDGTEPVRRRRKLVEELPPPTPSIIPDDPPPIRLPEIDPNPLFQMAAEEEPEFDPVHPLPEKPKPERKKKKPKPAPTLPDFWPVAELPVPHRARQPEPSIKLPDFWPVAQIPAVVTRPPAPPPPARFVPETFEVLAYRHPRAAETIQPGPIATAPSTTIIVSPPEPAPPPPKHLTTARERKRFTWESPEMYWEEGD